MATKAKKAVVVVGEDAQASRVAALSSELSSMLNKHAVPLSPIAEPPSKGITKTSTFKGRLVTFDGLFSFDIACYNAAEADSVKRNYLHAAVVTRKNAEGEEIQVQCLGRIRDSKQRCEICDVEVEKMNIIKGIEISKGQYAPLTDDEIAEYKPRQDNVMTIVEFVDPGDVHLKYVEDSEYVALDPKLVSQRTKQQYYSLIEGLKLSGKYGRGVRINKGREQYFLLSADGNGLMLHHLFAEYEIRECNKFEAAQGDADLAQVVAQLIEAKTVKFVPAAYDNYLNNVRSLIEAKKNQQTLEKPVIQSAPAAAAVDIMAALKASLTEAKAKKAKAGK